MKNILLTFIIFLSLLNAKDTLYVQQQNVLYVQNLIEIEEKIASNFEKYILQEFKIPSLNDLKTDEYLGSNFTTTNKFGTSMTLDGNDLKISYAITKDVQLYVLGLYKRDLYRDMTTVYQDLDDSSKSYVSFELKSEEAVNLFEILKTNATIIDECSALLESTYCITNLNTIRWYDEDSAWIEYSMSDFENGNVTVSKESLIPSGTLSGSKLDNLKIGVNIFVRNGDKYLKLTDSIVRID